MAFAADFQLEVAPNCTLSTGEIVCALELPYNGLHKNPRHLTWAVVLDGQDPCSVCGAERANEWDLERF